jgi:DNA-binding GntR family transcriptional regulator
MAKTLSLQLADKIRTMILARDYPQDNSLRELALAKRLGVSRVPVREALRILEAEGFVEINPYRGATVTQRSTQELHEIVDLRCLLDVEMMQAATARMDAEVHDSVLARLREAELAPNSVEYQQRIWEFWRFVGEISGRPLLLSLVTQVHNRAARYQKTWASLYEGSGEAVRIYRQTLELFLAGRTEDARALLTDAYERVRVLLSLELQEERQAAAAADCSGSGVNNETMIG